MNDAREWRDADGDNNTEGVVMEAHAWTPPRLTAGRAQETIRQLNKIRVDLADIRHMLESHDQGGHDDPCDLAARDIAPLLAELKSAAQWLELLS